MFFFFFSLSLYLPFLGAWDGDFWCFSKLAPPLGKVLLQVQEHVQNLHEHQIAALSLDLTPFREIPPHPTSFSVTLSTVLRSFKPRPTVVGGPPENPAGVGSILGGLCTDWLQSRRCPLLTMRRGTDRPVYRWVRRRSAGRMAESPPPHTRQERTWGGKNTSSRREQQTSK